MKKIASVLIGIGSPMAKLCLPVLMSLVLMALILFAGACSEKTTEVPYPAEPLPETRNWLFTVYGTAPNNILAAGTNGALFHYDGNLQNRWTLVPVGTSKIITNIWGPGDGTLYATGHGGMILRSQGGSWSTMASGTTKDLYSLGRFGDDIFACGFEGTLLKLNDSGTWANTPRLCWNLDASNTPIDTLDFDEDIASLTTVNSFFIGGAYNDPRFTGPRIDTEGTLGGVFQVADHTIFPAFDPSDEDRAFEVLPDWILRPLSGEQLVDDEWILCSTSNPVDLGRNFLGTSEGWLFQLSDDRGDTVWTAFYPSVTTERGKGIQAIWLDALRNIYMVTDEGQIVYQTANYNFKERTGSRTVLYDGIASLTGIWGYEPRTFFVVGYMDDKLLRCTHDPGSGYFNYVKVSVHFPAGKAMDSGPATDKFGRPLY